MRGTVPKGPQGQKRGLGTLAACLILGLIPSIAHTQSVEGKPKPDEVAQLERKLNLPVGARPLNAYARYYWVATINGKRIISGTFVYGPKIGIYLRDSPVRQTMTDQGCNWIVVSYSPHRNKISATCDGIG
jgi:hypothetical protein